MVYKKYIKRGSKIFGPYYYKSYRENGKIKTRFLSGPREENRKLDNFSASDINYDRKNYPHKNHKFFLITFIIILSLISFFSLLFFTGANKITGYVISNIGEESIESFDKNVDLEIKEPVGLGNVLGKNKNKRMDFNLQEESLRLYFDLLNYSEFVEQTGEVLVEEGIVNKEEIYNLDEDKINEIIDKISQESVIDAENFDIKVDEQKAREQNVDYKWGYKFKLNDLKFLAKIDVTSEKEVSILNEHELRIGNYILSFQDLVNEGYRVRVERPVLKIDTEISKETSGSETSNKTQKVSDVENKSRAKENVSEITKEIVNESEIIKGKVNESFYEVNKTNKTEPIENNITINETEINKTRAFNETIEAEEGLTIINETIKKENTTSENVEQPFQESSTQSQQSEEPISEPKLIENENSNSENSKLNDKFSAERETSKPSQSINLNNNEIINKDISNNIITGNIIKSFAGITGKVVDNFQVEDLEYSNIVSIYIERDFTGTEYRLGTDIYLDPTIVASTNITNVSAIETWSSNNCTANIEAVPHPSCIGSNSSDSAGIQADDSSRLNTTTNNASLRAAHLFKYKFVNGSINQIINISWKWGGRRSGDGGNVSLYIFNDSNSNWSFFNSTAIFQADVDMIYFTSSIDRIRNEIFNDTNYTQIIALQTQQGITLGVESDFVTLTIAFDDTGPSINITNPTVNNSNTTDTGLDINFTVSDETALGECWYSNDTYSVNRSTGGCGVNITNITWSNALHNLTIYVNDSSGNLNFSSISFNISVAEKGEAEDGGGGGGGGGGGRSTAGGGGGSGAIIAPRETKLIINPKILEVSTIVNKTVIKEIEIFNKGNFDEKIKINIKSLEDIIDIGDLEFILDSGKKRKIKVRITPSETGVYVGKIIINGEEVLVSINVQSENLLVNVNLTIPKKFKAVNIGDKLKGNFQLTTTNLKQGTPVTISYIIRDYEGNKYITETETLFLENTENFEKEFNLEKLEPGNYLLSTELVYVNGFAVSSSNFEVKRILSKTLVLTSLVIGVLLLTLINIIILRHFRKLKKLRKFRKMKRYKR